MGTVWQKQLTNIDSIGDKKKRIHFEYSKPRDQSYCTIIIKAGKIIEENLIRR